jgi:5-oxoprolinase (ATP-hydrolysing) subunit A
MPGTANYADMNKTSPNASESAEGMPASTLSAASSSDNVPTCSSTAYPLRRIIANLQMFCARHPARYHAPTMNIDLNCDLGEGCATDGELLPLISSANVACGWHAGDAGTAMATVRGAVRHGICVGAHPGFNDREHFGRRELARTEQQVFEDTVYQIGALCALSKAAGTGVRYIKPHGALYNMACRDDAYGRPLIKVAEFFRLPLLGLPGSRLQALCKDRCRFVAEGFADRQYRPDGSLVPRDQPDAFVHDPAEGARQALRVMRDHGVETICVHGDNPQALAFVRELRQALLQAGCQIRAFAP